MLDFHTHILPNMDDGSGSIEESLQLLDKLEKDGVDTLILTPHFYPMNEGLDEYLNRRDVSYKRLKDAYKGNIKLLLGSEVHYYRGIDKSESIYSLCVENSDLLLLELPMSHKVNISEIIALNNGLQVVLAHIERYLDMYSKGEIHSLVSRNVYLQTNSEVFSDKYFDLIKDLFEQGAIHFVGSDTHNNKDRCPTMDKYKEFVKKEYSDEFFLTFDEKCYKILEQRKNK